MIISSTMLIRRMKSKLRQVFECIQLAPWISIENICAPPLPWTEDGNTGYQTPATMNTFLSQHYINAMPINNEMTSNRVY